MSEEKIPEHPDLAQERREAVPGLIVGFAAFAFVVGLMAFAAAASAEMAWAGKAMPDAVRQSVDTSRTVAFVLMAAGVVVGVLGTYSWHVIHGRRKRRPW